MINSIRLGLFLSLFNGGYKFILWFLRKLTDDEKISSFIAGVATGLFLVIERKGWRSTISLIVLSRAAYTLLTKIENSNLKIKIPAFPKYEVPLRFKIPNGEILFTCLIVGFVIYISGYHREVISKTTHKMIFKWTMQTQNDFIFRYLWRAKTDFLEDLQDHSLNCLGQIFKDVKVNGVRPLFSGCSKHSIDFNSIYSFIMKEWEELK